MSTRRARIKAVAALPPRRKNADSDKNKQNVQKDGFEKRPQTPKSPRTPKNDNLKSPTSKTTRTPPPLIPISSNKSPLTTANVPSSQTETQKETSTNTISNSETENSLLSPSGTTSIRDVFASPPPKNKVLTPKRLNKDSIKSPCSISKESLDIRDMIEKIQEDMTSEAAQKDKETDKVLSSTNSSRENNQNDAKDDYSVLRVPETTTKGTIIEGIIPLEPAEKEQNSAEALKNAEAFFDPIVSLPSPCKVRPKLKPVPRLAPHRRNSVQGSASESEDESRRVLLTSGGGVAPTHTPQRQRHDSHTSISTMLSAPIREPNRTRNDSISSSVSQVTVQPPPATSPVKEKHFTKTRKQDTSKRSWRRRRDTAKPDVLTMYDLIFFNPTSNPIVPDQDEVNAKEANAKEAEKNASKENEEEVDDPPADDAAPVPQIKLGPNGEIILDEKSLVIKQSDANRKVSSVVREGSWAGSGGGKYTRAARTAEWSSVETVRFYRALAAIGTDFTLMAPLFPDRNRRDLKLKFKKEEKINGAQVDMALRSATSWDVSRLMTEFKEEREEEKRKAEEERKRIADEKKAEKERARLAKEMGLRNSRAAKALELKRHPDINEEMTGDYFLRRALQERRDKRRKKETPSSQPKQETIVAPISQPNYATLSLISDKMPIPPSPNMNRKVDMATITRLNNLNSTVPLPPKAANEITGVPNNIETGSLVVLRVNDPNSPSTTMLQTYIAHGAGKLTPVALPSTFLNSVVGYMKKGTPSTVSAASSPLNSPGSISSQDSRSCTPGVIQLNPSPAKRQRHTSNSYTITPL